MEDLFIDATEQTPEVRFEAKAGKLFMAGRSLPEDPYSFFTPLKKWILDYVKKPAPKTEFTIKINYFNSSTSKYLLTFFRILEKHLDKKDLKITWIVAHEGDIEEIETFNDLLKNPINFVIDKKFEH